VEWYDELLALAPSDIVRLNRAVAIGEAQGAEAGLAVLAEVNPSVPRWIAVSAYLHERAGEIALAAAEYATAARRATSESERDHLTRQATRLRGESRREA
jgi:predicted RNA polymerase sigma factor